MFSFGGYSKPNMQSERESKASWDEKNFFLPNLSSLIELLALKLEEVINYLRPNALDQSHPAYAWVGGAVVKVKAAVFSFRLLWLLENLYFIE